MSQTLLVIDDGENIGNLMSSIVRQALLDVQIITAQTGTEGLQLARTKRPDVIMLDVKLLDMNGFEVCRLLRSHPTTKDIRILMVSGVMNEPEDRIKGLQSGADDYLFKPFCISDVVTSLRKLMQPS